VIPKLKVYSLEQRALSVTAQVSQSCSSNRGGANSQVSRADAFGSEQTNGVYFVMADLFMCWEKWRVERLKDAASLQLLKLSNDPCRELK